MIVVSFVDLHKSVLLMLDFLYVGWTKLDQFQNELVDDRYLMRNFFVEIFNQGCEKYAAHISLTIENLNLVQDTFELFL